MEGDLDKLAEIIFMGDTCPISSIEITGDFTTTRDLFEALLMLFTKGMRILFAISGTVNLSNLTPDEFDIFVTKFQAIGVTPIVAKYHIYQLFKLQGDIIEDAIIKEWEATKSNYPESIPLETLADYQTTNKNKLDDYYFQFRSESNYYIVSFKLL